MVLALSLTPAVWLRKKRKKNRICHENEPNRRDLPVGFAKKDKIKHRHAFADEPRVAVVPIKGVGHTFPKSAIAARVEFLTNVFVLAICPSSLYSSLFPSLSCFVYAVARLHPLIPFHGPSRP